MITTESLTQRFVKVFERRQATVLAEAITEAYTDLVKTGDFNELKAIVKNLAEAQERTEKNLDKLTRTVSGLAEELGGMSKSMAYALENEAYRNLPASLAKEHGIQVHERIVRTDIGNEEINIFAPGERGGESILLVGESKMQLNERRRNHREADRIFQQLESKVDAVQHSYPDSKIVPLLITHYARPKFLDRAHAEGIIVIQSFEWA